MIAPYLNDLKLVLLTHIHGDHFKASTIGRMAKERPLLRFGACEWLVKPLLDAGVSKRQIDILESGYSFDYGAFSVIPFPLKHDVPNCGYKVHFPGGKAIYATDTDNLDGVIAKDYDLYLIEANFETAEIRERILQKEIAGQYAYEYRVLKNHLSKEQCDNFLARNMGEQSEFIYLHMHEEREGEGCSAS